MGTLVFCLFLGTLMSLTGIGAIAAVPLAVAGAVVGSIG